MSIDKFPKQPGETLDYDFSFEDWLASKPGAVPTTHEVVAAPGITVEGSVRTGGVVKVVVSGGTDGQKYKVTVRLTATLGAFTLLRELEAMIVVKES